MITEKRRKHKIRNEKYRKAHRGRIKQFNKEYRKRNKENCRKQCQKWRKENPNKVKAHLIASKIPIPSRQLCEMCFKMLAVLRHHWSYDYPLDVKFLCNLCHKLLHNWKSQKIIKK